VTVVTTSPYAVAVLAGVAVEALLWVGFGSLIWKGVSKMDLTKETKIGNYWYPLRAVTAAIVIGAGTAVLTVVTLVQFVAP
jgi:multisubunit Na+/H+ antiporter MnhC subunit